MECNGSSSQGLVVVGLGPVSSSHSKMVSQLLSSYSHDDAVVNQSVSFKDTIVCDFGVRLLLYSR